MIELDRVAMRYGDNELFYDASLSLTPGSFHFLTGPSGAGKTTLIRLCYGDLLPTGGNVRLFGDPTVTLGRDALAHARRRIGVVHQDGQFLDHLSVEDNVALPLIVSGQLNAARRSEVRDLLGWVGLSSRRNARPQELSGGEKQRAALARALILSPDVILADEPTGNVDWEMSVRLLKLLLELNRLGKAVLLATHDLSLIRSVRGTVQARVLRLSDRRLGAGGADI
ncbi:cell division ATP-binding protein FtsE [Qingshengfaniella alkalisoli]|uniref:ATP-binding cassette domain-containing protein n=1 Tax=Qingshengfaniella alkalisoli TaxID=2599296 RepID=A0A5B8IAD8_9RHOB|nr:ATP-binding cassette domain-containing protein [Qingshengfaniella alkalisoli]QDY70216.1 ATP-binding cassette domain-containing protein [Qingshengfaniella alkalisoli]